LFQDDLAAYIIKRTFTQLLKQYSNKDEVSRRPALLTCFTSLLSSIHTAVTSSPFSSATLHSLLAFRLELLPLLVSGITNPTTSKGAIECIVQLGQVAVVTETEAKILLLEKDEIEWGLRALEEVLKNGEEGKEVER
jgi:hypothetical protein